MKRKIALIVRRATPHKNIVIPIITLVSAATPMGKEANTAASLSKSPIVRPPAAIPDTPTLSATQAHVTANPSIPVRQRRKQSSPPKAIPPRKDATRTVYSNSGQK